MWVTRIVGSSPQLEWKFLIIVLNHIVHFHELWKATKYSHQIQDGQSLSPTVPSGGWCVWIYALDMFPDSHGKTRGKKRPKIRRSVHIFTKAPCNTPHFLIPLLVFFLSEVRNFSHTSWGRTSRCRSLPFWTLMKNLEKSEVTGPGISEQHSVSQPGREI